MTRIYDTPTGADEYTVNNGDTLSSIATARAVPWQDIALGNWGTAVPEEVNRALIEQVGITQLNANPEQTVLAAGKKIIIPKPFTRPALAIDKTYTVRIKPRKPMPAVRFRALSQWFIPQAETCQVDYALEGMAQRADKVTFEVYASNNCSVTATNDGEFVRYAYQPIADGTPIFTADGGAAQRSSNSIADWSGQTDAAQGVFHPVDADDERYINVAHSPYTVNLRYYLSDKDKTACIVLAPFWPKFQAGSAVQASLLVEWTILTTRKLRHGQLLIWDKNGNVFFRKALDKGELDGGRYQWNGQDANGTALVEADMPYRVEIQAHTGIDEDEGLAIAAMHTEVRLYAHRDIGTDANHANQTLQSLRLSIEQYMPDDLPARGSDRWIKLRLAETGFHPGPVDDGPVDGTARPEFKVALQEFQRSVPSTTSAPFARFTVTDGLTAARATIVDALDRLEDDYRPMFGNPANRSGYTWDEASPILTDKTQALIVWVDDRHSYTANAVAPADPRSMGNYRGTMQIGDAKTAVDAQSIPRPWVPLQVELALLSKNDPLDTTATMPIVTAEMRNAIGPLRVDWKAIDLPIDSTVIDVGATAAEKQQTRAKTYIEQVTGLPGYGAAAGGQQFFNCPETFGGTDYGGIRTPANYYREPFGHGTPNSLRPWLTLDDNATQSVCTTVHDRQGQDEARTHIGLVGTGGIFFRPSRIAGDGYRLHAQVKFEPLPGVAGATHPNFATLKERYPKLPDAYSAAMRVWRKESFKGYVGWLPSGHAGWETAFDATAAHYRGAFVHFVHEGPDPTQHKRYGITTGFLGGLQAKLLLADPVLLDGGSEYETLVTGCLAGTPYAGLNVRYTEGYIYPFMHLPGLGTQPRDGTVNEFVAWLHDGNAGFETQNWDRFSQQLMDRLIDKAEKKFGRLRGHLMAEFLSSTLFVVDEYACNLNPLHRKSAISNHPQGATTLAFGAGNVKVQYSLQGTNCSACAGQYARVPANQGAYAKLPLSAIGRSLGGAWLFSGRRSTVWAHEIGHHKHLVHAQGSSSPANAAPGAVPADHDAAVNPHNGAQPAHNRAWDRHCIMSYDQTSPQRFCGKCLLKLRGWRVQPIANPAGNLQDP